MKLKRHWSVRHYRVPLAYGVGATIYALAVKLVWEPWIIKHTGMTLSTWTVPLTANVAGILTAWCARRTWFD